MKIVEELIDYFKKNGRLAREDLVFLKQQGFYLGDLDLPESDMDISEMTPEEQEEEEEELIFTVAADEERLRSRKGKGGKSRRPQKKRTLRELNQMAVDKIPEWEESILPLYTLFYQERQKNKTREGLCKLVLWNKKAITAKVRLLLNSNHFERLVKALFTKAYFEEFFEFAHGLSVYNRDKVQNWILSKRKMRDLPDREAFWWIRQLRQLQRILLEVWLELNPSFMNRQDYVGETYRYFLLENKAFLMLLLMLDPINKDRTIKHTDTFHLLFEENVILMAKEIGFYLCPTDILITYQTFRFRKIRTGNEPSLSETHGGLKGIVLPQWFEQLAANSGNPLFTKGKLASKPPLVLQLSQNWFKPYGLPEEVLFNEGYGCYHFNFQECQPFSEGFAGFVLEGKWGFINRKGMVVVDAKYDTVSPFSEGMAVVGKGDKFGVIDQNGKLIIPFDYDAIHSFSEGKAVVKTGRKKFFIDQKGKTYVFGLFEDLMDFHESRAAFMTRNGKWGFIDHKGNKIVTEMYDFVWNFREQRALVKRGDLYGYIDIDGNEVIRCEYDAAGSFNEGFAVVEKYELWGLINLFGKRIFPCDFQLIEHCTNGKCGYQSGWSWGFLNPLEKTEKKALYNSTNGYYDGMCVVNGYQFINENGITQFRGLDIRQAESFFEQHAAVKLLVSNSDWRTLWGFINLSGEVVIPPEFRQVLTYKSYINKFDEPLFTKNILSSSSYTAFSNATFSNGLAAVKYATNHYWTYVFKADPVHDEVPALKDVHLITVNNHLIIMKKDYPPVKIEGIKNVKILPDNRVIVEQEKREDLWAVLDWDKVEKAVLE